MNRLSLGRAVLVALAASPSLLAQTATGPAAASETSALENESAVASDSAVHVRFSWVIMTALGSPVVPDV